VRLEISTASNVDQVESWIEGKMDVCTRESGGGGEHVLNLVDPGTNKETEYV